MAPGGEHDGKIVSAHSLSIGSVLRKISTDSHVYAKDPNPGFAEGVNPIQIKRVGISNVSVFNGFCAKHDRDLYSCIENEAFNFTPVQNFMLSYRTVCRECYLKRRMAEGIPTIEEYKKIHGIEEDVVAHESDILFQASALRGATELEAYKAKLDLYLENRSFGRLVTKALIFPTLPTIAAAYTFQPYYDMEGNKLQNFEDLDAEMSMLSVTIMPIETGGAAIFSWIDTANGAPQKYYESFKSHGNFTTSLIHVATSNSENVAFAHDWYENLPEQNKKYLLERLQDLGGGMGPGKPSATAPFFGDWGAPSFFET